jgi:hypothetical protein
VFIKDEEVRRSVRVGGEAQMTADARYMIFFLHDFIYSNQ